MSIFDHVTALLFTIPTVDIDSSELNDVLVICNAPSKIGFAARVSVCSGSLSSLGNGSGLIVTSYLPLPSLNKVNIV